VVVVVVVVTASRLLWLHVCPPRDGEGEAVSSARCWVCGGACDRAKPRAKWMGANFVGCAAAERRVLRDLIDETSHRAVAAYWQRWREEECLC